MVRKKYTHPVMEAQYFYPNEFVAACNPPYEAVCGVGNKTGVLFEDVNKNGVLDAGDSAVNELDLLGGFFGGLGFSEYHACGLNHDISHDQYNNMMSGFLVGSDTVQSAKGPRWSRGNEAKKRTNFNYDILAQDATPVWIWHHDYGGDQVGWHATPLQGGITTNHS